MLRIPKAPASLEPHHQIVKSHMQDIRWWVSCPYAELQSVYSIALVDWAYFYKGSKEIFWAEFFLGVLTKQCLELFLAKIDLILSIYLILYYSKLRQIRVLQS